MAAIGYVPLSQLGMQYYNDQPTPEELRRLQQLRDQQTNAVRTPVINPQNRDQNVMSPGDMTFYNYLSQLGLLQERN